jgi:hypothetical protein
MLTVLEDSNLFFFGSLPLLLLEVASMAAFKAASRVVFKAVFQLVFKVIFQVLCLEQLYFKC